MDPQATATPAADPTAPFRGDRLLRLAEYHEHQVSPEQFSLRNWQDPCGTVACAIGHACRIPEFAEAGLRLVPYGNAGYFMPAYGEWSDWYAVAEFFGIDHDDAEYLFGAWHYDEGVATRPDEVAARIREFVCSKDKPGQAPRFFEGTNSSAIPRG
jgi:hypothetical protein